MCVCVCHTGGEGDLQALVKEVVGQSGQCGNVGIPLVGGAGVTSALVQASAQSQSVRDLLRARTRLTMHVLQTMHITIQP